MTQIDLIITKIVVAPRLIPGFATADAGADINGITTDQTIIGFDGLFDGFKRFGFTFPIIAVTTTHFHIPNLGRVAMECIRWTTFPKVIYTRDIIIVPFYFGRGIGIRISIWSANRCKITCAGTAVYFICNTTDFCPGKTYRSIIAAGYKTGGSRGFCGIDNYCIKVAQVAISRNRKIGHGIPHRILQGATTGKGNCVYV